MTGLELMEWIRANHAEGLPVVCEQKNDSYPGFDVEKAEILKAKYGCGYYAKADDPTVSNWMDEANVVWLSYDA